jgi:hypothetical protein
VKFVVFKIYNKQNLTQTVIKGDQTVKPLIFHKFRRPTVHAKLVQKAGRYFVRKSRAEMEKAKKVFCLQIPSSYNLNNLA